MGEFVRSGLKRYQLRGIQLEEHHGQVLDSAVHGHLLGQQAHVADPFLTPVDVQPDHMVRPDGFLLLAEGEAFHVGVAGHILQHALGLPEKLRDVLLAAGEGSADMPFLLRQKLRLVVGRGIVPVKEHLGLLKNRKIAEIALVLCHCLAEVRKQGGADIAQIRSRRRGKPQDPFRTLKHRVHIHVVHPGIGVDLLHAAAESQVLLDAPEQILILLVDGAGEGCRKGRRLKIVIAVHSGHLFHHVVLDGNIPGRTPGGSRHMHVVSVDLHLEAQKLQLVLDFFVGQILSEALGQPGKAYVDLGLFQLLYIIVAESGDRKLRIQLFKILHGKGQCLIAALRVYRLLVAGGSLRAGVVAQSRPADAGGLEIRHLQDYPGGLGQDGVLGAAHDAGQGYRTLGVGDNQIVRAERQLLIV